jgi:protein involved in ribonucleotide reduction
MVIVYDTLTGNTERFVKKLPKQFKVYHINDYDGTSEFIMVTYTTGFGMVPKTTEKFLEIHGNKMLGVSSGGNKNWGLVERGGTYGKAADLISQKYSVPIISKFELQGTDIDIENFIGGIKKYVEGKMD